MMGAMRWKPMWGNARAYMGKDESRHLIMLYISVLTQTEAVTEPFETRYPFALHWVLPAFWMWKGDSIRDLWTGDLKRLFWIASWSTQHSLGAQPQPRMQS
jgi:hypothetical protein